MQIHDRLGARVKPRGRAKLPVPRNPRPRTPMIRFLVHPSGSTLRAHCEDECVVLVETSASGEASSTEVNTYAEHQSPPEYTIDALVAPYAERGFVPAPIPDLHLAIEAAFGVTLPAPVRAFFAEGRHLEFQGKRSETLDCELNFTADSVLGNYDQEHWDRAAECERHFIPISARMIDGSEDEQSWVGIDPKESTGAVYALYTSGSFEPAFDTFDAFLKSL